MNRATFPIPVFVTIGDVSFLERDDTSPGIHLSHIESYITGNGSVLFPL